jgi:UDP-N-acetylmuramate dehydrogenase
MGGGSNLVVADEGFDGLVVRVDVRGRAQMPDGADTLVTVGAGEPWDETVAACVAGGLAGLECLSGIPGTVGGTPVQNVGAYGQDVAQRIESLTAYDRDAGAICGLRGEECGFSYRMSRFKKSDAGRFVICDVTFRLRPGRPTLTYPDVVDHLTRMGVSTPDIADVRNAVLAVRRRKGMVIDQHDPDTRSVGSFFMNPVVAGSDRERVASVAGAQPPAFPAESGRSKLSAAWLIERAGFRRGDSDGHVGISSKHTLAVINRGGATARDVLRFAASIKRGVLDRFGINLRPEPVFVGFDHNVDLEFLTHVQSPD